MKSANAVFRPEPSTKTAEWLTYSHPECLPATSANTGAVWQWRPPVGASRQDGITASRLDKVVHAIYAMNHVAELSVAVNSFDRVRYSRRLPCTAQRARSGGHRIAIPASLCW